MYATTNSQIVEEDLPVRAGLRAVRISDPDYGMTDDEIRDRNEFIRCYICQDNELLMMIPATGPDNEIFIGDYDVYDSEYSAFNTHDYQRTQRPFDKYGYAMKQIMERVKDLAILHSCISDGAGRQEIYQRYLGLVDYQFRDQLNRLAIRHRLEPDPDKRWRIKRRIMSLSRRILECKKVWEHYAPWDV